jgi:hypothetical protein
MQGTLTLPFVRSIHASVQYMPSQLTTLSDALRNDVRDGAEMEGGSEDGGELGREEWGTKGTKSKTKTKIAKEQQCSLLVDTMKVPGRCGKLCRG